MIKKVVLVFIFIFVFFLKPTLAKEDTMILKLKDGDVIYYDKHAGHDISWKDTLYRVIRDGDVVLVC